MLGQQQQMQLPVLAALAAAILLGRSRPDLAQGAAAAAQAGAIQTQLSYSRDFEREADRIGFQSLRVGRLRRARDGQRSSRRCSATAASSTTAPCRATCARHPVTTERIADAQNRAASLPYRQHPDSLEFQLVRAKLRAEAGDPRDAVQVLPVGGARAALRQRGGGALRPRGGAAAREAPERAEAELARLRADGRRRADDRVTLAARMQLAQGDRAGAAKLLGESHARYPNSPPAALRARRRAARRGQHDAGDALLGESLRLHPRDPRLHELQAKAYAALGKRTCAAPGAGRGLRAAGQPAGGDRAAAARRTAGDGDFYELSVIDARLKDLRAQHAQELKDAKR